MECLLSIIFAMAVPFVPVPKDVPQADDPQVESQDITEEDNKPEIPNIENNTAEENLGAPKVLTKITIYNREGNVIYYGPPINFKRKVKTQLGSSDIVRIRRVPRVTPPDISEVETDLLQDTPPTASRLQLEDSILHRSRSVPFIKASPRCYPDSQLGSIRNIPGFPLEVGSIVQVFLPQRKTQVGTVEGFYMDYVIVRWPDGTTNYIKRVFLQMIAKPTKDLIRKFRDKQ